MVGSSKQKMSELVFGEHKRPDALYIWTSFCLNNRLYASETSTHIL